VPWASPRVMHWQVAGSEVAGAAKLSSLLLLFQRLLNRLLSQAGGRVFVTLVAGLSEAEPICACVSTPTSTLHHVVASHPERLQDEHDAAGMTLDAAKEKAAATPMGKCWVACNCYPAHMVVCAVAEERTCQALPHLSDSLENSAFTAQSRG